MHYKSGLTSNHILKAGFRRNIYCPRKSWYGDVGSVFQGCQSRLGTAEPWQQQWAWAASPVTRSPHQQRAIWLEAHEDNPRPFCLLSAVARQQSSHSPTLDLSKYCLQIIKSDWSHFQRYTAIRHVESDISLCLKELTKYYSAHAHSQRRQHWCNGLEKWILGNKHGRCHPFWGKVENKCFKSR